MFAVVLVATVVSVFAIQPVPVMQDDNQVLINKNMMNNQPPVASHSQQELRASGSSVPCGFSCSRSASLLAFVDDVWSQAACSDGTVDSMTRCVGCCQALGLSVGLSTDRSAAFPSTNGRDCICCQNRNQCR